MTNAYWKIIELRKLLELEEDEWKVTRDCKDDIKRRIRLLEDGIEYGKASRQAEIIEILTKDCYCSDYNPKCMYCFVKERLQQILEEKK